MGSESCKAGFLKAEVTRQADVTRILPLINELEALPEQ
ncbi:TPA: mobC protein [Escherichia coli]|nr:mobC protein [Escherichia coli]HAJ7053483.1 mobC protein [Escherichia coli]